MNYDHPLWTYASGPISKNKETYERYIQKLWEVMFINFDLKSYNWWQANICPILDLLTKKLK